MCGINGFNFENKDLLDEMNKTISYRGPDKSGTLIDKVSLGFLRLSIIDLSDKAMQPMFNREKDLVIVFNGEIYNFQEIRKELEKKYEFSSKSDTETILHAYEEWGEDCVKKFNGMWAFCIYDKKKNILFLSRDRFGVKPLYYYFKNGKFIFSSEIKAILKHKILKELNPSAISSFLSYRYVLGSETFYKDIYKAPAGHNLILDLNKNQLITKEYWDIPVNPIGGSEDEILSKLDDLLKSSVMYRKISDVPIGVILSGGLDSSLVTSILADNQKEPINTFTVKFNEEGFDETKYARLLVDKHKANYFEVLVNQENFIGLMEEYTKFKDEPIGVPNEIALYLLSKKIKKYVTVVLSGEGADEIFEGYGRIFSSVRDFNLMKKSKFRNNSGSNDKLKILGKYDKIFEKEIDHFLFMYQYWRKEEIDNLLLENPKESYDEIIENYFNKHPELEYSKKISYVFLKLHLPALLNRLDQSTMSSSIEGRTPFLDYRLSEFVFNLDTNLKTRWTIPEEELMSLNENCDNLSEVKNVSKYILKKLAKKYIPEEIINRKKQGFPIPLNKWFDSSYKEKLEEYLLSDNSKILKFVNKSVLKNLIENPDSLDSMHGQKLWMLLSLEIWLRQKF